MLFRSRRQYDTPDRPRRSSSSDLRTHAGRSCRSRNERREDRTPPARAPHEEPRGTCSEWRPGHPASPIPSPYRRSAISSHRDAVYEEQRRANTMLPRAALIPPCAATVCERVGNSLVITAVLNPYASAIPANTSPTFSERPMAARRPAPPAPTTTQSYS